jgi:hypothetical protein
MTVKYTTPTHYSRHFQMLPLMIVIVAYEDRIPSEVDVRQAGSDVESNQDEPVVEDSDDNDDELDEEEEEEEEEEDDEGDDDDEDEDEDEENDEDEVIIFLIGPHPQRYTLPWKKKTIICY